jgi:predicted Zn-dependent protease
MSERIMTRLYRADPITDRPTSRFLSEAECAALAKRAAGFANGGGNTRIQLESRWSGNLRYAQNHITTSGDVRDNDVSVLRDIRGAFGLMLGNQIDDVGLEATVRRAERLLRMREESGGAEFEQHYVAPPDTPLASYEDVQSFLSEEDRRAALRSLVQTEEVYAKPHIFFETTYGLDADHRADAVAPLIAAATKAGMMAAGYVQVSAHGRAVMDTTGKALYYPYTQAQFSVTVRNPQGTGAGWAGVDWNDWTRIDTTKLSEIALDKCVRSANPVAVEPGRYVAVLEPQAVCDLVWFVMRNIDRVLAESGTGPFAAGHGQSKIGQKVMDSRITISADPMDPDLGFPPFSGGGHVYHPVTWIKDGILKELAYYRPYGIRNLGKNSGLPNSGAFRMSGGTTTVDEMIATTKRGVLVTRFSDLRLIDVNSLLLQGYTRDGLWLIESGKISKPIKNFRFTESPMFVLNKVEQLGAPRRVFHPGAPVIVPSIKVRDFNFVSLSEAI